MIGFTIVIALIIAYYFVVAYKNALLQKREQVVRYLNEIIHTVEVEKINGIEYWYDFDNHKFLGQGGTFDEVLKVVKSRFPDHIFLFKDHNGGLCAKTNWQIVPFDELKKLDLATREGK